MKCGLLGRKLGHSYSPQIHAHLGSYDYSLFEKEPEEVEDFLKHGDFSAINVTIPYKKTVLPFCQELSPVAKKMNAVNTIVRKSDGSCVGHNTDYFGFSYTLKHMGISPSGKKALVFGSGGASNTAVAVLQDLNANVVVISHGENTPQTWELHPDARILVNATPEGMYPKNGSSPADLTYFPKLEAVVDMIYNPARTHLLLDAEKLGIPAENGLRMLVSQAKESAEWFLGHALPDELIEKIYRQLKLQMENIILIGMPGSGKTTIGRILSQKLGKTFVDADEILAQNSGMSTSEILKTKGEPAFRAMETAVLDALGKESGLILSTGGGCVTREENYPLLHQNGTIFCIQRELDKLSTQDRPLSQNGKLNALFQSRKPMYQKFADHFIDNNTTVENAVDQILTRLNWEEL